MVRRAVLFLSLLFLSALAQSSAATAGIEWCAEDPVFSVLGANFRLTATIAAPVSQVASVTWDVTVPSDAEGATTVQFSQSGRPPTTVNVKYAGQSGSTFSVTAKVTVVAPSGTAITLDVAGPDVVAQSVTSTTDNPTFIRFIAGAK